MLRSLWSDWLYVTSHYTDWPPRVITGRWPPGGRAALSGNDHTGTLSSRDGAIPTHLGRCWAALGLPVLAGPDNSLGEPGQPRSDL
jgi:hypothetical protein